MIVRVYGSRGVVPTNEQMVSFSISDKDQSILFDLGSSNIFSDIQAVRNIKTILLSHHHHDHIAMLPHFILAQIFQGVATEDNPTKIISPEEIMPFLESMGLEKSKAFAHSKEVPQKVGSFRIKHTVTNHPVSNYAYRVQSNDKTIVYTGDTSLYPGLSEFCKGADLLIVEASYKDEATDMANYWGHMTPSMVAELAQRAKPSKILLIHLVHVAGDEFANQVKLKVDFPCDIFAAYDGLLIQV